MADKIIIDNINSLPEGIQSLVDSGIVTYRGCGMGKYSGNYKIKINKKEYIITSELFNSLGSNKKMKFNAPFRKE